VKRVALVLCLGLLPASVIQASTFDVDKILDTLQAQHEIIKQDFDQTQRLMDAAKKNKTDLADATSLMDAIDHVLERTGAESYLLNVYGYVTDSEAQADTEKLIREQYGHLAQLTAVDVQFAHIVARCKSREISALAAKVETDIQKIADRYEALSKTE
jgi:hypothetical protein